MDVGCDLDNCSSIVSNKPANPKVGTPRVKTSLCNANRTEMPSEDANVANSKRKRSPGEESLPMEESNKKQVIQTTDTFKNRLSLVSRSRELIAEDLDDLLCNLYPRLDRTLNSNFVPRFNGRGVASGRIWFECANVESRTWLEKQIRSITDSWSRGSFDIVEWIPAPSLQRVCVSIPWMNDERTPAQLVVTRLDNLNPHLGIKRWHLFKAAKPWEGKRLFIFGLDIEALNLLEENEFCVYYAFGKLTAFKYTNKK